MRGVIYICQRATVLRRVKGDSAISWLQPGLQALALAVQAQSDWIQQPPPQHAQQQGPSSRDLGF